MRLASTSPEAFGKYQHHELFFLNSVLVLCVMRKYIDMSTSAPTKHYDDGLTDITYPKLVNLEMLFGVFFQNCTKEGF